LSTEQYRRLARISDDDLLIQFPDSIALKNYGCKNSSDRGAQLGVVWLDK
jgi:hypothetical protein